jgi:hydrogenase maturation protease
LTQISRAMLSSRGSGRWPQSSGATSAASRAIVVGYGNPLRSDDAVGQIVARAFAGIGAVEGVEALACHQLLPELAERLSAVGLAVFVDAAVEAEPGSVTISELAAAATLSPLVHSLNPRGLIAMAGHLFGRSPRAVLVEVGAASFDFSEALSEAVAAALPRAIAAVREVLSSAQYPVPTPPHPSA